MGMGLPRYSPVTRSLIRIAYEEGEVVPSLGWPGRWDGGCASGVGGGGGLAEAGAV